jgi:hypothetical protein
MIKNCIENDPLGFLNLDYEDFKFFTITKYNKFFPKEIMKLQNVAPSKVYSTKSEFPSNSLSDLMGFAGAYTSK